MPDAVKPRWVAAKTMRPSPEPKSTSVGLPTTPGRLSRTDSTDAFLDGRKGAPVNLLKNGKMYGNPIALRRQILANETLHIVLRVSRWTSLPRKRTTETLSGAASARGKSALFEL